jgi:hypothetical protein
VPLNFDVVTRRHAGAPPFGIPIGLGRPRHQGRSIDRAEVLAAAGTKLAHQMDVEVIDLDADRDNAPVSSLQQGGRLRSDWVVAFDRNRWPPSVGIGGRFASDSAIVMTTRAKPGSRGA